MDYDNPYAPSSSYQVDNSIMRPANLPALSLQTIGSDRNAPPSGFRGGPPPFGGGGPDRNAPRRGGYRGGQGQRGRPPRGPGAGGSSHSYQDRNVNNFPGMNNGYHNNAPLANGGGGGGYDGNGYEPDRHLGAQPYMQGGYAAGGPGNAFPRDSTQQGFAPPRNEYDGELCCFSLFGCGYRDEREIVLPRVMEDLLERRGERGFNQSNAGHRAYAARESSDPICRK